MPADEFAERLLNMVPTLILIPTSWQPDADDVFSLLQIGCRGYLCKPFTCESIESALTQATKGEPIAQAILDARDRNEAFAALLAGCVDRLSTLERQSSAFVSASKELGAVRQRLSQASQIARTFARGGEAELREAIVDFLINLSNGPATKLGRLRKRLSTKRQDSVPENVKGDPPTRKPLS
jgi:DNA-binding NarL/FixJ family response regulator